MIEPVEEAQRNDPMNFLKKDKTKQGSWVYSGEVYKEKVKATRPRRYDFIAVALFIIVLTALIILFQ